MIKKYYTLRVNGYDQNALLPFETMQGALLCLRCWGNDGRLKATDRCEVVEHLEIINDINSVDILGASV